MEKAEAEPEPKCETLIYDDWERFLAIEQLEGCPHAPPEVRPGVVDAWHVYLFGGYRRIAAGFNGATGWDIPALRSLCEILADDLEGSPESALRLLVAAEPYYLHEIREAAKKEKPPELPRPATSARAPRRIR